MTSLRRVQCALSALYDLEPSANVDDFVCDELTAQALGGEDALERREVLFVVEDHDEHFVGLYLDPQARIAIETEDAWCGQFDAMCLAAEGVSHFVYVQFRADHHQHVQELELELQAEVDKYVLALLDERVTHDPHALEGNGVGILFAGSPLGKLRERSRALRHQLFAEARFIDDAESARGERYRTASKLAGAYAEELERLCLHRGALLTELRRFYRLGMRGKVERCGG